MKNKTPERPPFSYYKTLRGWQMCSKTETLLNSHWEYKLKSIQEVTWESISKAQFSNSHTPFWGNYLKDYTQKLWEKPFTMKNLETIYMFNIWEMAKYSSQTPALWLRKNKLPKGCSQWRTRQPPQSPFLYRSKTLFSIL